MLRASLSAARKMRLRSVACADLQPRLEYDQRRFAIELAISTVFGIDSNYLWSGTRGVRDIAEARQVAMYLAHICCAMSLTEVGVMFGRDRTTVAHACLKVECRRDNKNFDHALDVLSWALPTLVRRTQMTNRPHTFTGIEDNEWL
jgi:chromosomal replication initiation ATPase DnaA